MAKAAIRPSFRPRSESIRTSASSAGPPRLFAHRADLSASPEISSTKSATRRTSAISSTQAGSRRSQQSLASYVPIPNTCTFVRASSSPRMSRKQWAKAVSFRAPAVRSLKRHATERRVLSSAHQLSIVRKSPSRFGSILARNAPSSPATRRLTSARKSSAASKANRSLSTFSAVCCRRSSIAAMLPS